MKIRKKEQNIIKTMPQNQQNSLRKNGKKLKSVKLYQEKKKKRKAKSSKMTRSENKRKEQETTGTQRWELLIATISNAHTFVHREISKTERK